MCGLTVFNIYRYGGVSGYIRFFFCLDCCIGIRGFVFCFCIFDSEIKFIVIIRDSSFNSFFV